MILSPSEQAAEKWIYLQIYAFSSRKMPFPTEKCTLPQKYALFCRKMHLPAEKMRFWRDPSNPWKRKENTQKKTREIGKQKSKEMGQTLLHKLFEHPQGSGTSRQNSWDIPDSSFQNPRKTNFRGRARSFRPPPLRVEDPHPTGFSGPKKLIFVLSLLA